MKECPRCLRNTLREEDPAMNSLSRRDNKTYICPACGEEEAMIDAGYCTSKFAVNVDKMFTKQVRESK